MERDCNNFVPNNEGIKENPQPDSISMASTANLEGSQMNSLESVENEQTQEYINPRGIRFTPQNQENVALVPYGIICVREMFRFLISLCNPLDKQNTDAMIHLGLSLLTVAFEVGADNMKNYSSLLALVKDELCRNLFSVSSHLCLVSNSKSFFFSY